MKEATFLHAAFCRELVGECQRRGVDTERWLSEIGVDRRHVETAPFVDGADAFRLWRAAGELADGGDLGLSTAQRIPFGSMGATEQLAMAAGSPGQGFDDLADVSRRFRYAVCFEVIPIDGSCRALRWSSRSQEGLPPLLAEFFVAFLIRRYRENLPTAQIARVAFAHAPGSTPESYARALGAEVGFNAASTEVILPESTWTPLPPRNDRYTRAFLRGALVGLGAQYPNLVDVVHQARSVVFDCLPQGAPKLRSVAKRIGISARVLQRRLQQEGLSFARLVDDVRRDAALELVATGLVDLAVISHELGYSDPTAFHRAFRRWTGQSPRAYQRTT